MHYNTIVIGAGPAGLFASQMLAKKNQKVLLLERNAKAGKKLLLSGSGQCNFTHAGDIQHFFECYGDHGKFLKTALLNFDNKKCMHFFHQSGIDYQILANGKVFPKSMRSEDILDTLLLQCQLGNVEIRYNHYVQQLSVYDTVFAVETSDKKRYFSDHVIITSGGKSYPKTGSDGSGYILAENIGHHIISPKPALTDVRTKNKTFACLSGLSFNQVEITVWHESKKIISYQDDLLLTHKGLSGPAILNASRWMNQDDIITVNFLFPETYEHINHYFSEAFSIHGKEELVSFLRKQNLPKSFCQVICDVLNINEHILCSKLSKTARQSLVQMLTKCPFEIESLGGFHMAMATAGGVALKEVNPTTMESRKQKGLFFAGEVLDIDGNTGGYNLQAAFSTAYLSAQSIINKKQK